MLVYLNGRFVPAAEATISALDRGFIFGDGVYEVWRVVRGRLFEAERHQARLERGLRELRIAQPVEATLDGILRIADRCLQRTTSSSVRRRCMWKSRVAARHARTTFRPPPPPRPSS